MNIENIKAFLSIELFTIAEQPLTLGGLLIIPLLILVGLVTTK